MRFWVFFFKYHYKRMDFTVFYMFHCTTVIILFSSSFIEISRTSFSCSVAQSCLILCNPSDCSPPGSSVQEDSPGKNTRVDCHFLLQGIFPTKGLNLHLLHWQTYSLPLSHLGSLTTVSPGKSQNHCLNWGLTPTFLSYTSTCYFNTGPCIWDLLDAPKAMAPWKTHNV